MSSLYASGLPNGVAFLCGGAIDRHQAAAPRHASAADQSCRPWLWPRAYRSAGVCRRLAERYPVPLAAVRARRGEMRGAGGVRDVAAGHGTT